MKINVDFMRRWVAAVVWHVNDLTGDVLDIDVNDVIPNDADSWADVLAILKYEDDRVYMECQNRLQVPKSQIDSAFKTRFQEN